MVSEVLLGVRDRLLPMLEVVAAEYRGRVPVGYPVVIDAAAQGMVGLELDPSYSIYILSDGDQLYAEIYRRAPRNDARTSASRQKQGGLPFNDRRPLPAAISDQGLRNLVAELMSYWNQQPGVVYISDS